MTSALQFAAILERGDHGTEPVSYVTTGVHTTFEIMVSTLGRSSTPPFVLCSLFSDELDLPQEACPDFPRAREWLEASAQHSTLFAAYGIRQQDILLRLPNRRHYIALQVEEYLAGLDTEWEERSTRWTLGAQRALEAGDALPPFPTVVASTPEGTDPSLENDRLARGAA